MSSIEQRMPSWWLPEDLEDHIESRVVLEERYWGLRQIDALRRQTSLSDFKYLEIKGHALYC